MTPRLPSAPVPVWLRLVLGLVALAALVVPALLVLNAPKIAHRPHRVPPVALPNRVVPKEELPPVEPVAIADLSPDDARAFNASIPFSTDPNPAARPFHLVGAADSQARALDCLAAAEIYEAGDDALGERAVAQVILNRVRHPAFPATVCGVVYQGSERAGCQFSFACDGAMARIPARAGWARAARTAAMALAGYVYAPVGLATHYHTYAVTPAWNRGLVMTDVVGAHLFHRWKGYWGTRTAFRQPYRGGEPVPGPHTPPIVPPVAASPTLIATVAPLPVAPVTNAAQVRPAYADSGSYVTPPAATAPAPGRAPDSLPPAARVLDKWKDSGKPLL